MENIGWPEIVIIIAIAVMMLAVPAKIFSKAGYSPWLAITQFVPIVNIIVLIWFAFAEWPILRHTQTPKTPAVPS